MNSQSAIEVPPTDADAGGVLTMGTADMPARAQTREAKSEPEHTAEQRTSRWQKYGIPALVLLLAAAVVVTITRDWNSWEGGRVEQVTDDAYVRGDITPLSTKVAGIVKEVSVY